METALNLTTTSTKPVHPWLKKVNFVCLPGPMDSLLQIFFEEIKCFLNEDGHTMQPSPNEDTHLILNTGKFNKPIKVEESLLATGPIRHGYNPKTPIYTLVSMSVEQFEKLINHFETALAKKEPDPKDFDFPGLTSNTYRVLHEYARPAGPIFLFERILQAQLKSFNIILVVGEDSPVIAYHFDLVGGRPRIDFEDPEAFYREIALRIITRISTRTIGENEVMKEMISKQTWDSLTTPHSMCAASREFSKRDLFSRPVYISDLTEIPDSFPLDQFVSRQYSDGCFATWDPQINALITTVTGSACPVDKGDLTEEALAIVERVKTDGSGTILRHVEGRKNHPPSVESVELVDMHSELPFFQLDPSWKVQAKVPGMRSKLHFHRGISSYDPTKVEFVPLDEPYYSYLVTCALEAQAWAIKSAFNNSQSLNNLNDPRQVIFTILPAHGVIMVEKWVPDTVPFQILLEYMDAGHLKVDYQVPQGRMKYVANQDGRMLLQTEEENLATILENYHQEKTCNQMGD